MLYMFDLDGTLIEGFLSRNEDGTFAEPLPFERVVLLPGRAGKLYALAQQGARFAIVTNQGGVAFGQQMPADVFRKLGVVTAAFKGFYGAPVSFHYCFTHPQGKLAEYRLASPRRKPGPGMLLEAVRVHAAGHGSRFVGDLPTDREAADAARASGIAVTYHDAEEFFDADR